MIPRLLRPRWLPFALAAVALGYMLPHFTFINQNFGILSSIGNFFANAAPPSSATTNYIIPPHSEEVIEDCQRVLSLSMWGLALIGAWVRRRSKRTVLTLLILAFSPFLLLGMVAYGNEGILRVYLFSLPWTAALAASAVAPTPSLARQISSSWGKPRHSSEHRRKLPIRKILDGLRFPLVLTFALTLFFPSFFGDDSYNVIPESEVTAMTALQQNYPVGPIYSATGNGAEEDTSRYNEFSWLIIFSGVLPAGTAAKPDIAQALEQDADSYTGGSQPAYIVVGPSMEAYSRAYGATYATSFTTLLNSLARSKAWKLIYKADGTFIYELPLAKGPQRASPTRKPRPTRSPHPASATSQPGSTGMATRGLLFAADMECSGY